jgi:selenocysteine lyase/cysteine desulfurase
MDWAAFRAQFPVTSRWAFLDHAAVAPLPSPAVRAFQEYADSLAADGIAAVSTWADRVAEVRRFAATLIHAPFAEDVCFVPNTTWGVGIVAEGFPWQPGDNVVLAAEEYPSNQYPWLNLKSHGVEVRSHSSRGSRVDIDDVRAATDGRTRVVAASFVQYASGFRANLDDLGEFCRSRGIFFFVDAIQGLGVFPLDVQRTPIDALSADGHKWLLGPEGAGIAYVRREWIDRLRPVGVGAHSVVRPHDYAHIDYAPKPHAGRYEGGALNVGGVWAMGASLNMLLEAGIDAVSRRVLELTDYLCDRAPAAGLEVFSSRSPVDQSGIVSLATPGREPKDVFKRCKAAGVVVNVRAGRVRVSPHAYNTEAEIDRLLEAAKGVAL